MIILANKVCDKTCLKAWIISVNGSFSIFYLYVSYSWSKNTNFNDGSFRGKYFMVKLRRLF